jgi:hypothetical protein
MPAKSEKQARFMQAVAHSPSFAKQVGVPQSVGREFTGKGSSMKKRYDDGGEARGGMAKSGRMKKMASGGLAGGHKSADGIAKKGKTRGMQVAMRRGGKC